MFTDTRLKTILKESKIISKENLVRIAKEAEKKKIPLLKYLLDQKVIKNGELYKEIAAKLKMPYVELSEKIIRKDVLFLVPEPIAATHKIIAFEQTPEELHLAVTDPDDLLTFEFISRKTGLPTKIYLTSPSSLEETLGQYRLSLQAEFKKITTTPKKEAPAEKKELEKLAKDVPVVRVVDTLIEHAVFEEASDVHIEPLEKEIIVRYRIDGVLRNVMNLPKTMLQGIVARVKILSNLKLDEHRLPQDGRLKIETPEYKFSVRVSVFPILDGEKIVMRLLPESAKAVSLEQSGLRPRPLAIIKRNIAKPHGMILATGPTGCGKTTTLYTILNILNKPGVNIVTVEDPVEYRVVGVNQSQVNPRIGFTFAAGLRSLLRQDPDIMMVGEIRDNETADIAVHSALTGHLVLSTLHTNDAATVLPRLSDMNIPPFLISSTINVIIAQRLVRKICKNCQESYPLSLKSIEKISKLINIKSFLKILKSEKIIKPGQSLEKLFLKRGAGCKHCGETGYKGRTGIFEVMEITKPIVELINQRSTAEALRQAAAKENMVNMLTDGLIKVVQGITTIPEVLRVTKE